MLWDHFHICGPSLTETLCGTQLYLGDFRPSNSQAYLYWDLRCITSQHIYLTGHIYKQCTENK